MGVECLAGGIDGLDALLAQDGRELVERHPHPLGDGGRIRRPCGGGQPEFEGVEDREHPLDERGAGEPHRLLLLAGRALAEIVQVRRSAQEPVVVLGGLGRGGLDTAEVFRLDGGQRRAVVILRHRALSA
jgi:hypothetical protein